MILAFAEQFQLDMKLPDLSLYAIRCFTAATEVAEE